MDTHEALWTALTIVGDANGPWAVQA